MSVFAKLVCTYSIGFRMIYRLLVRLVRVCGGACVPVGCTDRNNRLVTADSWQPVSERYGRVVRACGRDTRASFCGNIGFLME
ncbi:MAG: hypothetical protein PHE53_05320 [Thermoguttaceae bacterium]|nr:hypothetical protein [Thermoguttaceae bacterium]